MAIGRMSAPKFDWQHHNFVLFEVIIRQPYVPVENCEQILRFQLLRLRIRPVTLEADRIRRFGAE